MSGDLVIVMFGQCKKVVFLPEKNFHTFAVNLSKTFRNMYRRLSGKIYHWVAHTLFNPIDGSPSSPSAEQSLQKPTSNLLTFHKQTSPKLDQETIINPFIPVAEPISLKSNKNHYRIAVQKRLVVLYRTDKKTVS